MMQPKKLVAVAALLGCLPITSCKTGQAISHKDDFKQVHLRLPNDRGIQGNA